MECPGQKYCYGPLPGCKKEITPKFCGTSYADAISKCKRECPTGRDSECGIGERCWDDTTCTVEDMSESRRRDVPNPANHYCGTTLSDALLQCDGNYYALPCPPAVDKYGTQEQVYGCPMGQFCFGRCASRLLFCLHIFVGIGLNYILFFPSGNLNCIPVKVRPGSGGDFAASHRPARMPYQAVDGEYSNPRRRYCYEQWIDDTYDGVCGPPCPR